MNILKSLGVLVYIVLIILISIRCVLKCKDAYESYEPYTGKCIFTGLLCLVALSSSLGMLDYLYPFDRSVKFELYATLVIPPENTLQTPQFWHAAYDNIQGDDSFFFDPDEKYSHLGFEWPSMDYSNHTYIITYGQELESLSYNVWDVVRYPFYTGVKIGHAELSDSFDPNIVYVYEIPRIRIDNNP